MMRGTNFRAWDTYNQAWADEYLAITEDGYVVEIKNDGTTEYWKDRFIIEFGTGLKDKNGKEIYEGDIVKRTKTHEILRNVEEIEIFRVRWGVKKAGFFAYNKKRQKHGMPAKRLFAEDVYEVIGNIHENKDLSE